MVQKFANFLFQVQNSKKNRQIEGKTSRVSRISHDEKLSEAFSSCWCLTNFGGQIGEFLVNFDWSKFKIRKEIRQIGGRTSNRQHWPTGKLISEFFLVVPSISRIFRPTASRLQFDTKFVEFGQRGS